MDRCRVAAGHARRKRQTNRRIVADGVVRPQALQVNSLDPRLHTHRRDVKIQSVLAGNLRETLRRFDRLHQELRQSRTAIEFLDTRCVEPVSIEKLGRAVVVVLSTEEYDRLLFGAGRKKVRVARRTGDQADARTNDNEGVAVRWDRKPVNFKRETWPSNEAH